MSRAVGIMVAPNGARLTTQDHPVLPVTIEKTVQAAISCAEAGAGAIHLHVRDDDAQHVLDVERYREAMDQIAEHLGPNYPVQVTTEAVGIYSAEQQIAMVKQLKPAFISAALAELVPNEEFEPNAAEFYSWCVNEGVGVQHILYSPADLQQYIELQERGVIPDSHRSLLFVLGRYTEGQVSQPEDLDEFLFELEKRGLAGRYQWMICAFGVNETACLSYAVSRGGHVRVGFENNRLHPDGKLAITNAERVEQVRDTLASAGNGLAVESEISALLGRPGVATA